MNCILCGKCSVNNKTTRCQYQRLAIDSVLWSSGVRSALLSVTDCLSTVHWRFSMMRIQYFHPSWNILSSSDLRYRRYPIKTARTFFWRIFGLISARSCFGNITKTLNICSPLSIILRLLFSDNNHRLARSSLDQNQQFLWRSLGPPKYFLLPNLCECTTKDQKIQVVSYFSYNGMELFSMECRKTRTKVISKANHK